MFSCRSLPYAINRLNLLKTFKWKQCYKLFDEFSHHKRLYQYTFLRYNTTSYPSVTSATGFDNYEEEYSNFKLDVPEYFNFAEDVLEKWSLKEQNGKRDSAYPAFWWIDDFGNEIKWSFKDLLDRANKISNVLSTAGGVRHGDRVIVILPRIPEWWLVNIACLKVGAILSPGTTSLTSNDIVKRINASEAVSVITTPDVADSVDQVALNCPSLKTKLLVSEEDIPRSNWLPLKSLMKDAPNEYKCLKTKSSEPMSWFFTSGTTGLPKMTEHTHSSYGLAHVTTGKHWLDLTERDIMWNVSDTGWAKSAYSSFYAPWWQGSCVFVHHSSRFDALRTLNILQSYPISVTCLPPTAYRMIVQEDLENTTFMGLRHCVSAGEPLNPEVIEKWYASTGLGIREGYGQTEMTVACGMFPCLNVKPGSMGKPTPDYDIHILGNDGESVAATVEGEVAIKCHPERPVGLFSRYVNDEERTSKAFIGDYYLTGDRAYKDEDGYLWFVGRSDDVIISAGYRIGPFEVESALIEHPAVAESAVIGSPCDIRGQVVKAYIILTSDFQNRNKDELTKEIQDHCKQHTAPYKYPRKMEFVSSLPKTISGKIRRIELREKEWKKCS